MINSFRNFLWHILGISQQHIGWVADQHFLKEDRYTHTGKKTYDNNAVVYRWSDAPLTIGKYCAISYGVRFILDDGKHTSNPVSSYPFPENIITGKRGITVGNDVWIGMNAIILNGVKIGNGATIAAGAVVTKDVPAYTVVGGVPASVISQKCTVDQAQALTEIAWWDWDDDQVKNAHLDFALPIHQFIEKYQKK